MKSSTLKHFTPNSDPMGVYRKPGRGVPQGSPLSTLLANILPDDLDNTADIAVFINTRLSSRRL
ncbi:MAG: hypothetical protein JXA35_11625 [Deltaproteobacteria bacterium]|nr:hypothetical protein [Deltaproteobacteria bacterium]